MLGKVSYGGVTTPAGFRAASASGDIKGKKAERDDCGLICSDEPCEFAAVFTSNVVKAAPVLYDMEILKKAAKFQLYLQTLAMLMPALGQMDIKTARK